MIAVVCVTHQTLHSAIIKWMLLSEEIIVGSYARVNLHFFRSVSILPQEAFRQLMFDFDKGEILITSWCESIKWSPFETYDCDTILNIPLQRSVNILSIISSIWIRDIYYWCECS